MQAKRARKDSAAAPAPARTGGPPSFEMHRNMGYTVKDGTVHYDFASPQAARVVKNDSVALKKYRNADGLLVNLPDGYVPSFYVWAYDKLAVDKNGKRAPKDRWHNDLECDLDDKLWAAAEERGYRTLVEDCIRRRMGRGWAANRGDTYLGYIKSRNYTDHR